MAHEEPRFAQNLLYEVRENPQQFALGRLGVEQRSRMWIGGLMEPRDFPKNYREAAENMHLASSQL